MRVRSGGDDEEQDQLRARIAHLLTGHVGELAVPVFRSEEIIWKPRSEQIVHLLWNS